MLPTPHALTARPLAAVLLIALAPATAFADSSLPPAAAPASSDKLIVPRIRAGAILLGSTVAKVKQTLGEPEEIRNFDDSFYYSYFSKGVSLRFERGRLMTIFLYSGVVGGYEKPVWTPYRGAMADGTHPRSTRDEVLARYGKPSRSGDLPHAPIPSAWIYYDNLDMQFDFVARTGEQINMSLSLPPPSPPQSKAKPAPAPPAPAPAQPRR